jgi:signal transduction histidine kinase
MDSKITLEQFVANCSKELKEPVNAIQGLVRIAEYYPLHDEIRKCLRLIGECAQSMDQIIHRADEFIGIEHHQPVMTHLLAPQLKELFMVEFAKSLSAHQLRLQLDIQLSDVTVDTSSMIKIFKYIMSNALKLPSDDLRIKTIRVQLRRQEGHFEMVMGDRDGNHEGPNAFDVFAKSTQDEAGLGLFLARSLAQRIGASISLVASSNEGTSIIVRFPVCIEELLENRL